MEITLRGKKSDPVFISEFLQECVVSYDLFTLEQIVNKAKDEIAKIDELIQLVEQKKKIRSKLLDVISSFEKENNAKASDIKKLNFFQIPDVNSCKKVCELLKIGSVKTKDIPGDLKFAVKQLLENEVIKRVNDELVSGPLFIDFLKNIFME